MLTRISEAISSLRKRSYISVVDAGVEAELVVRGNKAICKCWIVHNCRDYLRDWLECAYEYLLSCITARFNVGKLQVFNMRKNGAA